MKWGFLDYQKSSLGNTVGSWAAQRCHTRGGLQSQCNFTGCGHGVESDEIESRIVWCQRSRRWFPLQAQDCLIKCNGICKCAQSVADCQKKRGIKTFEFEKHPSSRTTLSQITTESWREVQYWIFVDAERYTEHFKMWISAELNYSFCSRAWATWWMFIHSSLTLKHNSAACWIRYKLHIILFSVDTLWMRQQIWKSYCMLWNQVKKLNRVFARELQIADSHLYDIMLPISALLLGSFL